MSAESEANEEMGQRYHFDVSGILETWKFTSVVEPLTLESTASASFLLPLILCYYPRRVGETLRFNELVRLLEQNGFRLIREKGSVRYYAKAGVDRLIRVDYHGAKEIPTGTCNAILKAAGLKR